MKKNQKNFKKPILKEKFVLSEETKKSIFGIVMFLTAVIVILGFFEKSGIAGRAIFAGLKFLIGRTSFAIPLILFLGGLVFFYTKSETFSARGGKRILGVIFLATFLLVLGISGILDLLTPGLKKGGFFGLTSIPLSNIFGFWVTQIIFGAIIIVGALIFWNLFAPHRFLRSEEKLEEKLKKEEKPLITRIFRKVVGGEPKFKVKEIEPQIKMVPVKAPELELKTKEIVAKPFASAYQSPPLDLLEPERGIPTTGDIRLNSAIIKKTLQNFDIPVEMSEINIGPTVTQYTFKPAEGVKLSKITTLSNDLSLALASHPIRIEAPIPGRSLVGIEVPNKTRTQVRLRNLIENPNFQKSLSGLTIVLGRDVSGNPVYADLARMPHLLVAGSTGTGKTIFLNSLIASLLYKNSPEILRFILIDPKRVEFPVYNDIPHLLCPVIYDAQKTVNCLKWLTSEMERRFEILAAAKARDINGYNEIFSKPETDISSSEEPLPYIVLIVDELADLMAAKGRDIEAGIVRLAQMARAVGIHLVVATQRPSVEVITGLIKANITSRVTFQVASQIDSRTVLDVAGAEKLLGLGDLLFVSAEVAKPRRIQGTYVSEKEVRKVVNWIKSKVKSQVLKIEEGALENNLAGNLEKSLEMSETEFEGFYGGEDPLYEEAKRVIIEARKASASLLQRRLRIGYARAARLIDMLEEKGIVGPGEGAKPREVFVKTEEEDEGWQKV